jgi:hypothetical protein
MVVDGGALAIVDGPRYPIKSDPGSFSAFAYPNFTAV